MEQQFIARALEVGATVRAAAGPQEAAHLVAEIFRSAGARVAVVSPDLGPLREPVVEALARAGAKLLSEASPEMVAGADIGVTRASLAIAETGSIVVAGNDLLPRLATMLPPIHVALVERRSLVPSLDDAGEYLRRATGGAEGEPVRYVSFVSGPSRTADVEKTLSTGVHGPRELHVVIVQHSSGGQAWHRG